MERKLVRKWVRNNTKKGGGPAEPGLQNILWVVRVGVVI